MKGRRGLGLISVELPVAMAIIVILAAVLFPVFAQAKGKTGTESKVTTRVTLKLMHKHLEKYGWHKYEITEESTEKEGIIRTGWSSSSEPGRTYIMTIDPMVEKNCLSFKVLSILTAPLDETPADKLKDLLIAISFINYRIILGKFAYDPRDGEIRFSLDIPIDKNTVVYEQFKHCLNVIVMTVEEYGPKLKAIVEGKKTSKEFIEEETE